MKNSILILAVILLIGSVCSCKKNNKKPVDRWRDITVIHTSAFTKSACEINIDGRNMMLNENINSVIDTVIWHYPVGIEGVSYKEQAKQWIVTFRAKLGDKINYRAQGYPVEVQVIVRKGDGSYEHKEASREENGELYFSVKVN